METELFMETIRTKCMVNGTQTF